MSITILDEQIGSVSTIGTVTIETKEVPVIYEVEYNLSSYFVNVLVTFREVVSTGRRVLYMLKIENHEISTTNEMIDKNFMIYESLQDGLVIRFPSLSLIQIQEIAEELKNSIIRRLSHFGITINKVL